MIEIEPFKTTHLYELVLHLNGIYNDIERAQESWKNASPMQCPQGCGNCCVDFEPDVLEIEALYMAAWLMHNDLNKALAIADETYIWPRFIEQASGCFLFDPENDYHCTVYGGRALICRLFGYAADTGKDGKIRWKPCRLGNDAVLKEGFTKRQYTEDEILSLTGMLPPVMSVFLREAVAIMPDEAGRTVPLREALPKAIRKLQLILNFIEPPEPNSPNNTPTPSAPLAA